MTPETQNALKVIVERAVRPVRATFERKQRMREELLAHVTEVFDDEFAKIGDEPAAVMATKQRFGDAASIAGELQRAVGRWDQAASALERIVLARHGDGVVRRALRWATYVLTMLGLTCLFVILPIEFLLIGVASHQIGLLLVALAGLTFGSALAVFQFVLLGGLLRIAWYVQGRRSPLRIAHVVFASILMPGATVFAEFLLLTGDRLWSVGFMGQVAIFIPFCLGIVFLVARKFDEERQSIEEWATLNIN
jgi:hypothetical protein